MYSLLLRNLQKKKASLVFCRNQSEIKELSQNLWINSGINFLPHAVNKQCKNESIILSNDKNDWMDDTLINFSSSMVDGFNRYLNLIELVTDDEKKKKKARNRFKIYKDYGYKVNSIDEKNLTINYL